MELANITGAILDAAVKVHSALGPGLYKSIYEAALSIELESRKLHVERQIPLSATYDSIDLGIACRVDLIVEKSVIVELKSTDSLSKIHVKQLLTYLRLADMRVGLLLNFGAARMCDGVRRVVNDFSDDPHAEAQRR